MINKPAFSDRASLMKSFESAPGSGSGEATDGSGVPEVHMHVEDVAASSRRMSTFLMVAWVHISRRQRMRSSGRRSEMHMCDVYLDAHAPNANT